MVADRKRIAIVTGAGRNTGRAIALALAEDGVSLALNTRSDADALARVVNDVRAVGVEAIGVPGDVSQRHVVEELVLRANQELGKVNIVVYPVAIRPRRAFLDVTPDDWRAVMATNVESLFHCAQTVLPGMLAGSWGRIVAFSGERAFHGYVPGGHVAASKHAVIGLVRSLAREFGSAGVTANVVVPGSLGPDRHHGAVGATPAPMPPVGRRGRFEEAASMCRYLVSEEAGFINGQSIHVNGGRSMA